MDYEKKYYKLKINYTKGIPDFLKGVMKKEYFRCYNLMIKDFNASISDWDAAWDRAFPQCDLLEDETQLERYNAWIALMANKVIAKPFNRGKNRSKILKMYWDPIEVDLRARLRWSKKYTMDIEYLEVRKD